MTDAAVVGAGVIGASCAVHLARGGMRVTLFDRAPGPGGGSTARATGGFRAQFATAINVKLSLLARPHLRIREVGYLWLASSEAELSVLAAAHAVQRDAGLGDARLVGRDEIAALQPAIAVDGIAGGAWCPTDGVIQPLEILRDSLADAERLGVAIRWGEPVVAIDRRGDRIAGVTTPRATYAPDLVVNAAGAWAGELARLAGVDIPIAPLRRQVAITEPTRAIPATSPLTIWISDGFHVRVRDDRVLLLRPTPGDPADRFADRVEPAWLDDIAALAPVRIPALRGVALDRAAAWAGLYEMTPDRHALLGFAPGCANLLLANGSSGHGVMHAPAIGLLVGELAVHGAARSLDIHALRPARFAEGDPVRGPSLL